MHLIIITDALMLYAVVVQNKNNGNTQVRSKYNCRSHFWKHDILQKTVRGATSPYKP